MQTQLSDSARGDRRSPATRRAVIALGANTPSAAGDPQTTLRAALALIERGTLRVERGGAWRSTRAEPPGSGPDFINGAAVLATELDPEALLETLHAVEAELGRPRRVKGEPRWRPRGVDLDLLSYEDRVLPDRAEVLRWMNMPDAECLRAAPEDLILPHPRLHRRAFVLAPLAEIAPDWRHPILGETAAALLAALPGEALDGLRPPKRPIARKARIR